MADCTIRMAIIATIMDPYSSPETCLSPEAYLPRTPARERHVTPFANVALTNCFGSRLRHVLAGCFRCLRDALQRTLKRIGTVNSKVSPGILGGGGGNGWARRNVSIVS